MKNKEEEKLVCEHYFTLTETEIGSLFSAYSITGYLFKKVAYVICKKCGVVLKQNI